MLLLRGSDYKTVNRKNLTQQFEESREEDGVEHTTRLKEARK
jgi:hypothetical protein